MNLDLLALKFFPHIHFALRRALIEKLIEAHFRARQRAHDLALAS